MEYFKIQDFRAGNPYVKQDTIAVAGTKETLNVNDELSGLNAHTGTILNISTTAELYVELSSDGTTFTDTITLYSQTALDLEDEDVHSIRLDASLNGTPYMVIAH